MMPAQHGRRWLGVFFALLLCGHAALAQDWAAHMLDARRAFLAQRTGTTRLAPFASGVLRGGDAPKQAVADVRGVKRLRLKATAGPDNYSYDQAIWGEPTLYDAAGNPTRLVDLEPASVSVGWGKLLKNKDNTGNALRIGGKRFEHGFWAHAPSVLEFELGGRFVRFEAWVGISVAAGRNGSAEFLVHDKTLERAWRRIATAHPETVARFTEDTQGAPSAWFTSSGADIERAAIRRVLEELGASGETYAKRLEALETADAAPDGPRWLRLYAEAAAYRAQVRQARRQLQQLDLAALRRAVEDLSRAYPQSYPGAEMLARLDKCETRLPAIHAALDAGEAVDLAAIEAVLAFRREALLANPLLDFGKLLLVRRDLKGPHLGLPANWQGNCSLPRTGYNDEIDVLDLETGALSTRFRPERPRFVGDVDLHFGADRMLFSMLGSKDCWQIWEVRVDGSGLRQVTRGAEPDVDNYDACYLPDGRILFGSTAPMRAVPCVNGSSHVANLFIMNARGTDVRQLCFDQEHNWCPTVMPNGRVLYLRWEYTDTPHSQTRLLFHMNPDGTGQMEFYGSNSYWPNGVFYARPVPGHPARVAGIVTGHHGVRRMGELVIFDTARGRQEANGVVQRIPGWGAPVEPIIRDQLVNDSWPKFLHPFPLSETYFLVACQPTPNDLWGIYLADTFDNLLLLKEVPGYALFEPIPLQPRPKPPVIPDKVDRSRDDAAVYMANVYSGPGLEGIPKGAVKELRVFTYHYGYRNMGGLLGVIGMDGPWDIKRVLGTVPVEEDGSAMFRVPANTPIAVHPLDSEGKALQRMRSWFTAMPGEVLSCVGCHEKQNTSPPSRNTLAARRAPAEIAPWYGPERGFSFAREVQPVLDHYCLGCHDGKEGRPDLRGTEPLTDWRSVTPGQGGQYGGQFSKSYAELHKYVRRPGIESDYHLLTPMEYHADTTELVQMLTAGHHGVELNAEAWDRIITWIDLNAPFHGYWHEITGDAALEIAARQVELGKRYAGTTVNPEVVPDIPPPTFPPVETAAHAPNDTRDAVQGWPFDVETAQARQAAAATALFAGGATPVRRRVTLGGECTMDFVLIPAGSFPAKAGTVTISKPFWMSTCEVSNAQYALFDPAHDSRVESKHAYQFGVHGFPLNEPEQPVVRVSWEQARAFCAWMAEHVAAAPGMSGGFSLPSQAQWEYACRAGAETPFWYGGLDTDFAGYANLADAKLVEFADNPYEVYRPLKNPTPYDDWIPKETRFHDGVLVTAPVGRYAPNPWGLHDMHGNVWEWTATGAAETGKKLVCGGSWYDRPKRATASATLPYYRFQRVFNVGFRIVCPAARPIEVARSDME